MKRLVKRLRTHLRNERGVAIPLMAITMIFLVGIAAVGIDTGRVAWVANEVQTAADVAATAGAYALADEENVTAGANNALQLNKVNNTTAATALKLLETGNLDANYTFTVGMEPLNAVRATAGATVNNIVLGAIGAAHSTVNRQAIATLAGIGSGIPTLPIVIGECNYNAQCYHQTCMPYLSQVPNPDNNSAWTAFFQSASNSHIDDYFPRLSGNNPCGEGVQQLIKVNDIINLGNGQVTPLLNCVNDLVNAGMRTFTIPIVECVGNFNQPKKVVGFAKIEVDNVVVNGTNHGIWLHGLYEGRQPGPPGGGSFGLMAIALVK